MYPTKQGYTFLSILVASLVLLAASPAGVIASSLTLAWYSNTEDDLAGYCIYRGTRSRDYDRAIDVGDVNQYTVKGLKPETRYYFALTAYDMSGNESGFSTEVSAVTDAKSSLPLVPDSESEGGCFIATAAYGSYLDPHVDILRAFRDTFLNSNALGRKFVGVYYHYGRSIARYIGKSGLLRSLIRQGLLPLVGMSTLSLGITDYLAHLFLPGSFLLILALILRPYSRQDS